MSPEKMRARRENTDVTPLTVYSFLPKMNCRECGEQNCLSFAAKLVSREATPEQCPPLLKKPNEKAYARLKVMLKPAVREIVIGQGDKAVKIGGKLVMYRHEFAYFNPTPIAIDVTDEMSDAEIEERVGKTAHFCYDYIGHAVRLDMIAVRSTTGDADKYGAAAKRIADSTDLPLVLCSHLPQVLEAGLKTLPGRRPLLLAATEKNQSSMSKIAKKYHCPLVASAPGDLKGLRSLVKSLLKSGIQDIILDPGTFERDGLRATLNNFTAIRRAACKEHDELFGFPLLGTPITVWTQRHDAPDEIASWRESCLAAMLMTRFADLLIMHSLSGWSLLPVVVLRQNLYTDPRKPTMVLPGLREFGHPVESSPVMFTTNFALTYYTVASDLEKAKIDAYLLVVDSEGIAVDSAVAGRKLTPEKVVNAIQKSGIADKVKHNTIIVPGKAARLGDEIEKLSGWHVLIGPKDSSSIEKFLEQEWKNTGKSKVDG